MSILREILTIQLALTAISFVIQLYALCSTRWALFESHIELGIPDEHGHYGLWTICTSKLVPEEITEDGEYVPSSEQTCEPIDILFKPAHNRTVIAILAIIHTLSLLTYFVIMLVKFLTKLFPLPINESLLDDSHQSRSRLSNYFWNKLFQRLFAKTDLISNPEMLKKQIRLRLYVISVAAASTSLAVMFAIVHRRPLRDTDPFQINQVTTINYKVWRGSGFWAQLTTLVLDMLITSLIAIEVRVLFVLQSPLSRFITRTCGSEPAAQNGQRSAAEHSTPEQEDKYEVQEVIVNPFFQSESFATLTSSRHSREREREIEETAISMHETRPKLFGLSSSSASSSASSEISDQESSNRNLYINSIEVRRLKQKALSESLHCSNSSTSSRDLSTAPAGSSASRSTPSTSASYTNPMFNDDS